VSGNFDFVELVTLMHSSFNCVSILCSFGFAELLRIASSVLLPLQKKRTKEPKPRRGELTNEVSKRSPETISLACRCARYTSHVGSTLHDQTSRRFRISLALIVFQL
jgi:hypothetical protein